MISVLPEHLVILIVEDRKDDVVLIRRALTEAAVPNPVYVVGDGEEAQAYLMGIGQYFDRSQFPLPDLILLDLKMPKIDGFELLRWIRAQPGLKTLRVVVLTSSEDVYDIHRAYELGANSFLVKPHEFINFKAMMGTLGSFWLKYSQSPKLDIEKARPASSPGINLSNPDPGAAPPGPSA